MKCANCGAELQEGREECVACLQPIRRPGLLKRLFSWMRSAIATKPAGTATRQVVSRQIERRVVFQSPIPPELQGRIRKMLVDQQDSEGPVGAPIELQEGESAAPLLLTSNDLTPEAQAPIGHCIAGRGVTVFQKVALGEWSGTPGQSQAAIELPPELRNLLSGLFANTPGEKVRETITFRDESGQQRTFHSLEDIPPELRAQLDKVLVNVQGPIPANLMGMEQITPPDTSQIRLSGYTHRDRHHTP